MWTSIGSLKSVLFSTEALDRQNEQLLFNFLLKEVVRRQDFWIFANIKYLRLFSTQSASNDQLSKLVACASF